MCDVTTGCKAVDRDMTQKLWIYLKNIGNKMFSYGDVCFINLKMYMI